MANFFSLVRTSGIGALLALGAIASCTVSEDPDDEGAGAGGESGEAGAPSGGTGGTSGGAAGDAGSAGDSGANGEGGAGAGGAEGGAAGEGGTGQGGMGGAIGNVCDGSSAAGAGAGGVSSVEGKSCGDYCEAFFATCADYADDAAFLSEADCRSICENFLDEQLCCRTYHVLRAAEPGANLATSCGNAAGPDTGVCN